MMGVGLSDLAATVRTLSELGMPTHDDIDAARERGRDLNPCPICKSAQVQFCGDYNNPAKDVRKCRICKCQAPRSAWQNRIP